MSVFLPIFLSLIGMALIMYGRKEGRWPHIVVGIVVAVFPYFVGSAGVEVAVAVALLAGLGLLSRLGY